MKRIFVTSTILTVAAASALAQATILFGNSQTYAVSLNGTRATSSDHVRVALYYAASGTPLESLTSTVTLYGPILCPNDLVVLPGLGSGWTPALSTSAVDVGISPPIDGVFPSVTRWTGNEISGGSQVYLQVRAWSGGYASWDDAIEAYLAGNWSVEAAWTTVPWLNNTGNPGGMPPTTPAAMALGVSGFNGLNLHPLVPEPSTFALAGLGVAALLLFRRATV